jgi:hypothetical protein
LPTYGIFSSASSSELPSPDNVPAVGYLREDGLHALVRWRVLEGCNVGLLAWGSDSIQLISRQQGDFMDRLEIRTGKPARELMDPEISTKFDASSLSAVVR